MAKHILVIDDDRTLTRVIKKTLEECDYDVSMAADGQEGLLKFQQNRPDLILLDISMPNMNGYTFLFELRKMECGDRTPVIVLTSKEEMEEICRVEGVAEYLIKPIKSSDLLAIIRKHI